MDSIAHHIAIALLEIAVCFSFWAWLRLDWSPWLVLPGGLSLMALAALLTRIEADFAGRAYAAYGGIYIAVALAGWSRWRERYPTGGTWSAQPSSSVR